LFFVDILIFVGILVLRVNNMPRSSQKVVNGEHTTKYNKNSRWCILSELLLPSCRIEI